MGPGGVESPGPEGEVAAGALEHGVHGGAGAGAGTGKRREEEEKVYSLL